MDNAGTAIKLGGLMTKRLLAVMAGFVLATSVAYADTGDRKDLQVFNDISKAVTRYTHFTVFDNVDAAVKDGVVTLTGQVTMPYKRDDIEKRVARIDGVNRSTTRSRFCRCRNSTISSVTGLPGRFTPIRTSGTTRSDRIRPFTSSSITAT